MSVPGLHKVHDGLVNWTLDSTANDSDKSFTVADDHLQQVLSIHAEITATADVGNRTLWVTISDGTNVIWASPKTGSIAANQKGVLNVFFGSPIYTTTAAECPMLDGTTPDVALSFGTSSPMYLKAGYVIRVYDSAAIKAAADDLTVSLQVIDYPLV